MSDANLTAVHIDDTPEGSLYKLCPSDGSKWEGKPLSYPRPYWLRYAVKEIFGDRASEVFLGFLGLSTESVKQQRPDGSMCFLVKVGTSLESLKELARKVETRTSTSTGLALR